MFERYTSKLLLSPKTSIGTYVFDVYLSINHNLSSTITSHPVQFGANISDHKIDEPDQLTFQIGMSDASQDLVKGQFSQLGENLTKTVKSLLYDYINNKSFVDTLKNLKLNALKALSDSRSVNAFLTLARLKVMGAVLTCVTRLNTYENMVIQSIDVQDTNETKNGLMVSVTLREVLITEAQKVQVKSTAQITQTTNKGTTNALDFDLTSKKAFTSTDYDEYGLGDF